MNCGVTLPASTRRATVQPAVAASRSPRAIQATASASNCGSGESPPRNALGPPMSVARCPVVTSATRVSEGALSIASLRCCPRVTKRRARGNGGMLVLVWIGTTGRSQVGRRNSSGIE